MTMITPARFLRTLKKTPVILDFVLHSMNHEIAHHVTDPHDGPNGWTTTKIICHLRDFELIFTERARLMVEHDNPHLPAYDHEALVVERNYAGQSYRMALAEFAAARRDHLALLESLSEAQWHRGGIHAENGQISIIEQALQISTHDVDHTEQIVRILESVGK
jgi:hypothetical protein